MRLLRRSFLMLSAAALLVCTTASAQEQPGDDFLKLVDTRKYAESWDASSDFLKQSVSRGTWATQVGAVRDTVGAVASRKLKSSVPQKDPPGAPPGDYLLMTYETVFASQSAPLTETLPLFKSADGRWRAVGYFIR